MNYTYLIQISFLQYLKEMYLLGRGELYLTFIDHAHNMMKGPPSNTVAYGRIVDSMIDFINMIYC